MQAETMPSISTCSHANPVQNLECFELELLSMVEENIKYPPIARDAGIQGVVMVSFVLTSVLSTIEDIRVLQPRHLCVDEPPDHQVYFHRVQLCRFSDH